MSHSSLHIVNWAYQKKSWDNWKSGNVALFPKESSRQGRESKRPLNTENPKQLKRVPLLDNACFPFRRTTASGKKYFREKQGEFTSKQVFPLILSSFLSNGSLTPNMHTSTVKGNTWCWPICLYKLNSEFCWILGTLYL